MIAMITSRGIGRFSRSVAAWSRPISRTSKRTNGGRLSKICGITLTEVFSWSGEKECGAEGAPRCGLPGLRRLEAVIVRRIDAADLTVGRSARDRVSRVLPECVDERPDRRVEIQYAAGRVDDDDVVAGIH